MRKIELAKEALGLMWRRKYLWLFGLFAGAGVGGGGNGSGSAGVGPGGVAAGAKGDQVDWGSPLLVGLIAAAVVFGLVGLVLHVVSEAALIEGVRQERAGARLGIRRGFAAGAKHFWRVLGLKVLFALALLVSVAVIGLPALLGVLAVIPRGVGIGLTVLLVLPGLPLLLTLYFLYEYSVRFAVLEQRSARESVAAAYRYVHGRLVESLQLLLISELGRIGGAVAMVSLLLPAVAVGVAVYFAAGLVPAVVAGSILGLPLAVAGAGAIGAFTSSVWTLGFLDSRVEVSR